MWVLCTSVEYLLQHPYAVSMNKVIISTNIKLKKKLKLKQGQKYNGLKSSCLTLMLIFTNFHFYLIQVP